MRTVVLWVLCAGLFAPSLRAVQKGGPRVPEPELRALVAEAGENFLSNGGVSGLSIGVVHGGEPVVAMGFGFADLELEVLASADTVYRIGSLTKQFTAALLLLAAERGDLSLESTLDEFVPDFPRAHELFLRQLLEHTAGIPNYTNVPSFPVLAPRMSTAQEVLALVRDLPFDFEPGTNWRYSNTGYFLAGQVLEVVEERSYESALEERILRPLGLHRTYYAWDRPLIAGRASGYDWDGQGFQNAEAIDMHLPGGAGALASTVGDLLEWQRALQTGRLLSAESLAEMCEEAQLPDGRGTGYGLGLHVQTTDGGRCLSHGGSIFGFSAALSYWPDEELGVAVLSNTSGAAVQSVVDRLHAAHRRSLASSD